MKLLPESWYRHHALLMALAISERRLDQNGHGKYDPSWAATLFKGLLDLEPVGPKGQKPIINPFAFPPSVRARLRKLAVATEFEGWTGAKFLTTASAGAIRTAKLIATLLHHRSVPPATLWKIAREELSAVPLPALAEVEAPLVQLSATLLSTSSRRQKLHAVTTFMAAKPSLDEVWPALQPMLVQPLLDWVPVVVGQDGVHARTGIMVPLIIDVAFHSPSPVSINGTTQDIEALNASAERAHDAARALWLNRYSNAPVQRRAQVCNSSVTIDLHLLEGITQACIVASPMNLDPGLDLTGRSLELPLALAIYEQLIGPRETVEYRASGKLGTFKENEQDETAVDTWLVSITGESAKALAAEAELADQLILATGTEKPMGAMPALFANSLGSAVDYAFGSSGDGHRFVRAADIAAGFKTATFDQARIVKFRDKLRRGPIVHQTTEPVKLVVDALCDVNRSLGKAQDEGFRSKGRYTFVRLSPTEQGDAAWAGIWSALDGDPADFSKFVFAKSYAARGKLVADQLSRGDPSMLDPRWSPHVLVLAGIPFTTVVSGLEGGQYRRFDIRRIMQEAGKILAERISPCDKRLQTRIGATRIILVKGDGIDRTRPSAQTLTPRIKRIVEKLSAFRYGFNFDIARRHLGENFLDELLEEKWEDGSPLLVRGTSDKYRLKNAPTAFEYLLPRTNLPVSPVERLAIHESAAHAIAPILRQASSEAHIGLKTSLNASWLDEAYYQLTEARRLAIELQDSEAKARLTRDRLRLLRLSGWFVLERLPAMMGSFGNSAVYEDFASRIGPYDHPALHARAANFATRLAAASETPAERRHFFATAAQHISQGASAVEHLDDLQEKRGSLFLISSERCHLALEGSAEPDDAPPAYSCLTTYIPLAIQNLPYMREIYWYDWFFQVGDAIEDPTKANPIYRAGLWNRSLPGNPGISDNALIGWAGTLGIQPVSDELLSLVRDHLRDGRFFQRRATAQAILPYRLAQRTHEGMTRLRQIAQRDPRRNSG